MRLALKKHRSNIGLEIRPQRPFTALQAHLPACPLETTGVLDVWCTLKKIKLANRPFLSAAACYIRHVKLKF
jgi:hypothetical protein